MRDTSTIFLEEYRHTVLLMTCKLYPRHAFEKGKKTRKILAIVIQVAILRDQFHRVEWAFARRQILYFVML